MATEGGDGTTALDRSVCVCLSVAGGRFLLSDTLSSASRWPDRKIRNPASDTRQLFEALTRKLEQHSSEGAAATRRDPCALPGVIAVTTVPVRGGTATLAVA